MERIRPLQTAFVVFGLLVATLSITGHALASSRLHPDTACNKPTACVSWANVGKGPAYVGTSTYNNGAAILTLDQTSKFAGIVGTAKSNGYGVQGFSNPTKLEGSTDAAIYGNSSNGPGVYGFSSLGPAGIFETNKSDAYAALEAIADTPDAAPFLAFNNATGGEMFVDQNGALAINTSNRALMTFDQFGDLNIRTPIASAYIVSDQNGNLKISGQLYTGGSCRSGCSKSKRVISYAQRSTTPTLEDENEATLRDGRAFVALAPDFSNAIDSTRPYLVTITAEGDSDGLYVTNKTPRGFEVRENRRGRDTLAFAYRVVARPFGAEGARLPLTNLNRPLPKRPGFRVSGSAVLQEALRGQALHAAGR